MDFMGHEISTYYILAGFMTHENVTLLSMYFMGHEKPMKTLYGEFTMMQNHENAMN